MDSLLSTLPSTTSVVTIIVSALVSYILWFYAQLTNYPPGPLPLPFIGNVLLFRGHKEHWNLEIIKLSKIYGNLMTIWLGPYPIVFIMDLSLGKEAFNKPEFCGRPKLHIAQVLKSKIGFAEGKQWEYSRKVLINSMREYIRSNLLIPIVDDVVNNGVSMIMQKEVIGRPFSPSDYLYNIFSNVQGCVLFNERFDSDDERMKNVKYISTDYQIELAERIFLYEFIPIAKLFMRYPYAKAVCCVDYVYKMNMDWIDACDKAYDGQNKKNLCNILINAKNIAIDDDKEAAQFINNESLASIMIEMNLAGTDGVHVILKWLFLYIAYYPHLQKRLRDEISSELGDRMPMECDMKSMHFTMAFVSETMRLRNSAPMGLVHSALKDGQIGGYKILKGTRIVYHQQCIQLDEKHWPNAIKFNPDRFLAPSGEYCEVTSGKYSPFGLGRRKCVGDRYALINIFLIIVRFLQLTNEFDIVLEGANDAGHDMLAPDPVFPWIQFPKPYKISLQSRSIR